MSKLAVTMAVGPYDHVRDLATGEVAVEGVDLNFLRPPTLEIFHRFTHRREFDVAEMSFGRYISLFSQEAPIIAIPVFPSRHRATLDAFTRYAVEQGVSHRQLDAPDLFDAGARELSSSYGRL